MGVEGKRAAILVTTYHGQPGPAELERLAAIGERPRKDYVELARALDADIIDDEYMTRSATRLARLLARRVGLPAGQIVEAYLRRGRYDFIVAWSDRLGLLLALVFKLLRSRRDPVMVSVQLRSSGKTFLLRRLRAHTHLGSIVIYGTRQLTYASDQLGVPRNKFHLALQSVDDRFWQPTDALPENVICAVGAEQRDYPTLLKAARGLPLNVELAIGTIVTSSSGTPTGRLASQINELMGEGLPDNVKVNKLDPLALRALYLRSRFAVIPLHDVDYDAGVTAAVEAMAMGKAVIITRTRGQVDIIRDGEQGIYVPPGNAAALRAAIVYLANHPEEVERMGRAGRALVEQRHSLDGYIGRLAAIVRASKGRVPVQSPASQDAAEGRGPSALASTPDWHAE